MLPRICLVVDDDPSLRAYVKTVLTHRRFRTLQAGDGVKALRLARKLGKALDLIVSDIEMPGGDGLTFVRSLRSSLPAIPIILISGNADPGNLDRLGGFCEFLQKPFTPKTLLDAVDRAAKFPDQLQANQGA